MSLLPRAGGAYIGPCLSWEESLGSRIRDELLAVEIFSCLAEAQVMVEDWSQDYNEHRPHSALDMTTPARFARAWRAQHGNALATSVRTPYGLTLRDGRHP